MVFETCETFSGGFQGFQCGMKQQRFYKVDCITFAQETRFLHETLRDVQRV